MQNNQNKNQKIKLINKILTLITSPLVERVALQIRRLIQQLHRPSRFEVVEIITDYIVAVRLLKFLETYNLLLIPENHS